MGGQRERPNVAPAERLSNNRDFMSKSLRKSLESLNA